MRGALTTLILSSSLWAQGVVINELGTGVQDFVELVNFSAGPVDLSGWTVTSYFRATVQTPLVPETQVTIPAGTVLASGGVLVLQEQGTPGSPGTLGPCSSFTGSNWTWSSSAGVEVILRDSAAQGRDYVYRNPFGGSAAPHLPVGLVWAGTLTAIVGDTIARNRNEDTHAATDWSVLNTGSPCSLNSGQWTGLRLEISTLGGGDASYVLRSFPALPGVEVWTLYSAIDHIPDGSGPFLGIGLDALPQLFTPLLLASPFHSVLDSVGEIRLAYPPGTLLPSLAFEAVAVALLAGLPYGPSNVVSFP